MTNLSELLEPIAAWFRSLGIPEPIVDWGHPVMMAIVVFVLVELSPSILKVILDATPYLQFSWCSMVTNWCWSFSSVCYHNPILKYKMGLCKNTI